MKATRRSVLIGAGAGFIAAGVKAATVPLTTHIYDSRLPESVAFVGSAVRVNRFDVATADATHWRSIRAIAAGPVIGLTGWSDWVTVRGFLEERGLRIKSEMPVKTSVSGATHLFRWEMG